MTDWVRRNKTEEANDPHKKPNRQMSSVCTDRLLQSHTLFKWNRCSASVEWM